MTPLLTANLLLALLWVALGGRSFAVGFLLGALALAVTQSVAGSGGYLKGLRGLALLVAVFLWELLRANARLARDIVRRRLPFQPAFLRVDVADLDPARTVFLANLVSMMPGTLTTDTDERGRTLVVHALYAKDRERARRELQRMADLVRGASVGPRG